MDLRERDDYAGIAGRYDLFERADADAVAFYRRLFTEHGVRRVLDCACGTGRELVLFNELGCDVVGSDLSPSMLEQARRRLTERRLDIELHQIDYRGLAERFAEPFDAVACLSTSIAHMPDETEVRKALRSMRAVLRDGGILVLSQGTTDKQWRERPRFILDVNTPEVTRLFIIDYHGRGATYHLLDILRGENAGLYVWSTDYPLMLLADDQVRLLGEAGFRGVALFGSYAFEPYSKEDARRLIAVAER